MKSSFYAAILVTLILISNGAPALAARCEGGFCNACTTCSSCNYCSGGGTCSVCQGTGGGRQHSDKDGGGHSYGSAPVARDSPQASEFKFKANRAPDGRAVESVLPSDEAISRAQRERQRAIEMAAQQKREIERQNAVLREKQPWTGRCVGVKSGDVVQVRREGTLVNLRLFGSDAPENGQPFAGESKKALASLLQNQNVKVFPVGRDARGRRYAWVFVGDKCANRSLIERGLAWHSLVAAPRENKLAALQSQARRQKQGLWKAQAVEPWNWQRGVRRAGWTPAKSVATSRPTEKLQPLKTPESAPIEKTPAPNFLWPLVALIGIIGAIGWALKRNRRAV